MHLNNKFLDNISDDQAIFTNSLIYRKMKNLTNGYDIYALVRLDDRFVWSKTNDYNISMISEFISENNDITSNQKKRFENVFSLGKRIKFNKENIETIFKSFISSELSYEDILRKTISTINNQPTEQISNKKKLGCEISKYFQNFVSKYKKKKHSAIDHKKYHFTGYTEWLSVQKTISGKKPKVKLFISSLEKSSSCNYSNDNFMQFYKIS